MFRKSVFIMFFVCLLTMSSVAMAYPWDNQLEWKAGGTTGTDANFNNPNNWRTEGTLPCPPSGPGPDFYCAVLPNQPGPQLGYPDAQNTKCSMLSLNPWDPTSWGGQDVNVTVLSTAGDINCGAAIQINSQSDYDSYVGTPNLVSRAIVNVYGGTVTTPNPNGGTGNLTGITIGGGGSNFGMAYGMLNIYGGLVSVPKVALFFGEIGLYGGTLQVTGDANFTISTVHPGAALNKVKIDGGTLIVAGNHGSDINSLRTAGYVICERGTLRDPVFDGTWTTLIADVNLCAWNPTPANNATNVHYKVNPVDPNDPCSITLMWSESTFTNIDANDDIYFGTSSAAVNIATKASPQYMGSRSDDNNDPCSFTIKDPNKFLINQAYYWRVDENSISNGFKKGLIWKFTTHNGRAYNPKPADKSTSGLNANLLLSWTGGDWADSHNVYFGTDSTAVGSATSGSGLPLFRGNQPGTTTSYSLTNLYPDYTVKAGTTYYWRIDEINIPAGFDGIAATKKGIVWSFTPTAYLNIDDFEDSMSTDDVNTNWPDHYTLTGCTARTGNAGRILVRDATGKYLQYTYNNGGHSTENPMSFSEAKRPYIGGTSFIGGGVFTPSPRALRIDYKGTATNAANNLSLYTGLDLDRMYVAIEDAAGNVSVYDNPDSSAQLIGNWTSWYISLYDINDAAKNSNGVTTNLNAITGFSIGFGQRCTTGDTDGIDTNSVEMFDNIRLYASTCVAGKGPTADLDGDCDVDLNDLDVLAHAWLQHADNFVFSPCTAPHKAPILWFKFNESGQNPNPVDYGTGDANNYTGTITSFIAANWKSGGGRDGNNCLYLPPGNPTNQCYVEVNVGALGFMGDAAHSTAGYPGFTGPSGGGISFSVWEKADLTANQFLVQWCGIFGVWDAAVVNETLEVHCPSQIAAGSGTSAVDFIKRSPYIGVQTYRPLSDYGGRWNHWAFVKEPNSMKVYANGNLVSHVDANGITGDPNANAYGPLFSPGVGSFRIGTRGGNWGMWSGYMQDFKVYDYNLSPAEVAYLATDANGFTFLPLASPANINTDGVAVPAKDVNQIVNFGDLAIMGKQWHTTLLWP